MSTVPSYETICSRLSLNEAWLSSGLVEKPFLRRQFERLSNHDAEHIRVKIYAQLFTSRKESGFQDNEVHTFLRLIRLEPDTTLRSWAIGYLVEFEYLTLAQRLGLRRESLLESKHHHFLRRAIKDACANYFCAQTLNTILQNEISQGNNIVELSQWPPHCEKLVILEQPFHKPYDANGVNHNILNDPHHWYAEYITHDATECLACRK